MKKLIAITLALLTMAALLAGCADKESGKELKKITFCLDWTPNTNHTGLYVAQAKGYYKDAGLDVTIVQPPEDGATALVAAGQAQFGVTGQDTLAGALALDEPLPVTAVAALLQHNSSGLIARAGEGMDRPAGMEGKVYATWNSPIELAMIKYLMEADGADFDTLTLIPNNITDEPGALAAHQADSIWVFYGWGAITAELRDFDYDFTFFKDYGEVMDYYTPIMTANNDFLKNDPEAAKAFLAATAKGYEYAIENPEEAAKILIEGDTTGSLKDSEELVVASQKWMCDQYKAEVSRWGYIDPVRWDGFYAWLTDNGLCAKPLGAGTGFTNDFLP
ncbi:MAG: ABC transporter substrate-binding protein [Clostridia bacterium]|nr:ABC transporter substrate-binding protein [Clostridia bacterium]